MGGHHSKSRGATVNSCHPGSFNQSQLIDLAPGETKAYPVGCVPLGSSEKYSRDKGLSWPDNGEYEWGGLGASCGMCNFNYGYGREESRPSGYPDTCKNLPWTQCSASTPGYSPQVRRVGYNGNPASCCLASHGGSAKSSQTTGNASGGSFSWGRVDSDTYTCDPKYGNSPTSCNSPDVTGQVAKYCGSQDSGSRAQWDPTKGLCSAYMVSSTPETAHTLLNTALTNAYNSKVSIDSTDPSEQIYISNLLQQCDSGPGTGICDATLTKFCQGYSREQVQQAYADYIQEGGDPTFQSTNGLSPKAQAALNLFKACSCHLQTSEYQSWAKAGVNEVNVACDPLCQLGGISQYVDGKPAECHENLCIIDNVTIDQVNSSSGDVNFNVVCGSCGSNTKSGSGSTTCRCIFDDINIFQDNSKIGNINFDQHCGGNCQTPDPNTPGKFIKIDCKTGIPSHSTGPPHTNGGSGSTWEKIRKWIDEHRTETIAIIVALIFIIILIMWWAFSRKSSPPSDDYGQISISDLYGEQFSEDSMY